MTRVVVSPQNLSKTWMTTGAKDQQSQSNDQQNLRGCGKTEDAFGFKKT